MPAPRTDVLYSRQSSSCHIRRYPLPFQRLNSFDSSISAQTNCFNPAFFHLLQLSYLANLSLHISRVRGRLAIDFVHVDWRHHPI
jgi:hypothetical protein